MYSFLSWFFHHTLQSVQSKTNRPSNLGKDNLPLFGLIILMPSNLSIEELNYYSNTDLDWQHIVSNVVKHRDELKDLPHI